MTELLTCDLCKVNCKSLMAHSNSIYLNCNCYLDPSLALDKETLARIFLYYEIKTILKDVDNVPLLYILDI